ncbi:MAG: hypothetical protein ABI416_15005 [Ginsengibacter sp.]
MRNKYIKLWVLFILLFSLQGFSQTIDKSSPEADKSLHPLLDKYYPRADTNKAVTTQIKPAPANKPVAVTPVVSGAVTPPPVIAEEPPATTTVSGVTTTPATTTPAITSAMVPALTTAPAMTPGQAVPTETVNGVATEPSITTPVITTTISINKTTLVTVQAPAQKVQTQPPPPPYMDTRLGSSTKQYDTWEKNKNGAGSVTTSPK